MREFIPQINVLLSNPDSVETIRDQIGAIIKFESERQYALADGRSDIKDFNFKVFLDNARPYSAVAGAFPIVNIVLAETKTDAKGNSRVGQQKTHALFFIDCIAFGNDSGNYKDDTDAAIRAWKTARVVRNILMSDAYLYLGLRGLVGERYVTGIKTGTHSLTESAFACVTARIFFEVGFIEQSVSSGWTELEGIDFEVVPSTGEIVTNAREGLVW